MHHHDHGRRRGEGGGEEEDKRIHRSWQLLMTGVYCLHHILIVVDGCNN